MKNTTDRRVDAESRFYVLCRQKIFYLKKLIFEEIVLRIRKPKRRLKNIEKNYR